MMLLQAGMSPFRRAQVGQQFTHTVNMVIVYSEYSGLRTFCSDLQLACQWIARLSMCHSAEPCAQLVRVLLISVVPA